MNDNPRDSLEAAYDAEPLARIRTAGVQRDIGAAVRQLGKAIEALRRIDKRLDGEDSDRFGHTLDAACIASDGLLRFAEGGWASDVGIVRRHDGR